MLSKIQERQLNQALLQLGLSEKEAMIYSAAIEKKSSSIIDLSNRTKLSRGTVFDIVEKLKKKGFLAEIKQGKRRKIVIENPTNKFYNILDQKHLKLEQEKNLVEDILPIIKSIGDTEDFKPQIRVYTGERGFKKVWDEILTAKNKEFLSIAKIEAFASFIGKDYLQELQERKVKIGYHSRAINEYSKSAQLLKDDDSKYNRKTRFTPKEFSFSSTEIIFDDKIAMFSTREENVIVIIESHDFAQTHRTYFEMMWQSLA